MRTQVLVKWAFIGLLSYYHEDRNAKYIYVSESTVFKIDFSWYRFSLAAYFARSYRKQCLPTRRLCSPGAGDRHGDVWTDVNRSRVVR